MRSFEYVVPSSTQEALAALSADPSAVVLAGGTDLVLRLKMRQRTPGVLVDIKRITDLGQIRITEGVLSIGATVTAGEVAGNDHLRRHFRGLCDGAGVIGSQQIRNRATVVGNVCNATPCADTVPALVALGASARVAGPGGEYSIPLEQFFRGPGVTSLEAGEMVLGIEVPATAPGAGSAYVRHTPRAAMDLAAVGVAVYLRLEPDEPVCADIRIVLGAVAPTAVRARRAEQILRGNRVTDSLLAAAADCAPGETSPISDVRASIQHRLEIARVLTGRALAAALADATIPREAPGRSL